MPRARAAHRPRRPNAPRCSSSATRTRSPPGTPTGRCYLIGPQTYPEWRRVLRVVVPVVVPIASISSGAAQYFLGGATAAQSIIAGIGTALMVAVQMVYWITLVFAFLERTAAGPATASRGRRMRSRTSRRRSGRPRGGRALARGARHPRHAPDRAADRPAVTINGESYPVFDPSLWTFWMPWFLAILALEVVFTLLRWRRAGGGTRSRSSTSGSTSRSSCRASISCRTTCCWTRASWRRSTPRPAARGCEPTLAIGLVVAVVVAAWDTIDGFRQAWLNDRAARDRDGLSPQSQRNRHAASPARTTAHPARSASCGVASPGAPSPTDQDLDQRRGRQDGRDRRERVGQAVERDGDAAEGQRQHEQQVREGEGRLGAERAGHQQPEPGERHGAERRARPRRAPGSRRGPGDQPRSPVATREQDDELDRLDDDDGGGLRRDEHAGPRGRPAEPLEDAVGPLVSRSRSRARRARPR